MYGDALTTKERIKERLSITATSFDDLFDNLILAVTARIQKITGQRFIYGTFTHELHDGSDLYGSRRSGLILKNGPVDAISSVQYKTGLNSNPTWVSFTADDYTADLEMGVLYFNNALPEGKRNIRVTYTAGYSGYSLGINNFWFFNTTPTGTVNGVNLAFTLAEDADQIIVYVDGIREAAANITFTAGTDTFTLGAGRAPYTSIAVDYRRSVATVDSDVTLPADIVEVAEQVVTKLFKRREAEGKTTEAFQESSLTWDTGFFNHDQMATIKNYRRGYSI